MNADAIRRKLTENFGFVSVITDPTKPEDFRTTASLDATAYLTACAQRLSGKKRSIPLENTTQKELSAVGADENEAIMNLASDIYHRAALDDADFVRAGSDERFKVDASDYDVFS